MKVRSTLLIMALAALPGCPAPQQNAQSAQAPPPSYYPPPYGYPPPPYGQPAPYGQPPYAPAPAPGPAPSPAPAPGPNRPLLPGLVGAAMWQAEARAGL